MKYVKSGLQVQIRADRPAGVTRAFFATDDGTERFEVATLHITIADDNRDLFDQWAALLGEAIRRHVAAAAGLPLAAVTNVIEKPHEKN